MEIIIQGKSIYGISGWDGTVEVGALQLSQIKRVAGSRNVTTVFRKLVKIFKDTHTPVKLPAGLAIEDLDLGDFMQVVIGVVAASKGRKLERTYICPHCTKEQPRALDIIKVFKPEPPKKEGGIMEISVGKEPDAIRVTCQNVRIRDFLEVHAIAEQLIEESFKLKDGKKVLDLAYASKEYGDIMTFEDEEDVEDFYDQLIEVGLAAARAAPSVSRADPGVQPGVKAGQERVPVGQEGAEAGQGEVSEGLSFGERLRWLLGLTGEGMAGYAVIVRAVADLSATVKDEYLTKCTNCKKEFKGNVGVEDYFFDLRWSSSPLLSLM